MVLVMVCATKNTYIMMLSPIMSIIILMFYWTFVACNCPVHVGVKGLFSLLLSQFPSPKSVCLVSLQTVLYKLHTYIFNIQATD